MAVQINTTQIFVEPRIVDAELKASLRDEGVRIGYPFCEVEVTSQDHEFRLQRIFDYYGWTMEVGPGYYKALQDVENIQI